MTIAWLSLWLCAALLAGSTPGRGAPADGQIECWDVFEITLTGPASGNPYVDVQWSATFSQGNRGITVPGFWDGAGTYKARFSPPAAGEWRYQTRSATPELNGKTGAFTATAPAGNNHGPVVVFDTFYLRHADGTPYHQFGTTCYAWTHQTQALQEQTLKTLAASPFNKIRFCVFPKSYVYNQNEPDFFAFKKDMEGQFDFNQPDPAFWRHFEQRILDLQRLGIQADLILWHPYDRWGFADMSDEEDDRYLRYCIARLSAYRTVWWSLANEYDFMTNVPQGHRGNKQWEDWDRFFSILQKEDPHQRLRGIHNGRTWYDHTKDWVTHASLQTSDMEGGVRFRMQYRKPVVYDECQYEGDIPQGWGHLTARDMTQRFWLGTLSGCYVGHGETYKHPQDILWWAKGGVLHGQSPQRIQWLKDCMAQAPAFHELQPVGDGKGTFGLAKEGEYYLVYCLDQRLQRVRLAGSRTYKVDLLDPWEMTVAPVATAPPGEYTFSSPEPAMVYRFTPSIAVDRDVAEPILRVGMPEGQETPGVKLHGYGLDRQFRGEIRDVQVFGSRVSSRGALEVDEISSRLRLLPSNAGTTKPRVVVSSDFPPTDVVMRGGPADQCSDPDDMQSMVRFLLYTNEFDVEALIASSGTFANIAKKQNMLDVIDLYDQVDENLRKRDSRYPTADTLRSVTFQGLTGTWGKSVSNNIGAGKDSEASNAIIQIVDKPDPRPIWFCVWGDCSTIAQAIWKVQNTRSDAELQTFLRRIRIHQIAHQDDTVDWLLETFPDLFIIYSKTTYQGMFGGSDPISDLAWVNKNVRQNHGPLAAVYPPAGMGCSGVCEGDSPSFLHLVSAVRGLNNPEDPTQESWGGQFKREGTTHHYVDGPGGSSISKWRSHYQAEFAQRADWMMP